MTQEHIKIIGLDLRGFKSFNPQGQSIAFSDITILLGANGSGKSNLISFFKMLNSITAEGLQIFVSKQGGADALLYYGPKTTEIIGFHLHFQHGKKKPIRIGRYGAQLHYGMPNRLFFYAEDLHFPKQGIGCIQTDKLDTGNDESALLRDKRKMSKLLYATLSDIRVYQFHDTSETAKVRADCYVDDWRYLRSDAGNLAAFLFALKNTSKWKRYYERIIRHIQGVMPQFADFDLTLSPMNDKYVRLNWREREGEYLFGPHQISDGALRFMALTALLLQPPETLPGVIVLDEPELGLHPAAIVELAGMIRAASDKCQVIVATQSPRLVDEFAAGDLVIVERDDKNRCSVFKRLDESALSEWLERYCLSELWEKNVLGGLP